MQVRHWHQVHRGGQPGGEWLAECHPTLQRHAIPQRQRRRLQVTCHMSPSSPSRVGHTACSPPDAALALASLSQRVVRSRFGNGTSEWYKYIQEADGDNSGGFAIGSASEDYVTNTHSFYLPNPQAKPFAIHFAKYVRAPARTGACCEGLTVCSVPTTHRRPCPTLSFPLIGATWTCEQHFVAGVTRCSCLVRMGNVTIGAGMAGPSGPCTCPCMPCRCSTRTKCCCCCT